VGYNTLTFSSLAKLDVEFASSLVSVSVLLGLIYTPILILLLG
jgi:predicted Na+-dependent transporter